MSNLDTNILWLLTRGRRLVSILLVLLTLLLAIFAARLQVEQDTHSMVSQDPGQLATYDRLRQLFGNDENLLLSVTHLQLLESESLSLISELTRRITAIEGVARVLSLSNARQLVPGPYGVEARPLLPAVDAGAESTPLVEDALQANPYYEGLLVSADRKTAGLIIELEDRRNDASLRRHQIDNIRTLMVTMTDRAEYHLTGVNVLDFMLVRTDGLPLTSVEDYRRIEQFINMARGQESVAGHFSILTLLRPLHRAETSSSTLSLPDNDDDLNYELELMANDADQSLLQRFLSADRKTARVSIRLHDIGSRSAAGLVDLLLRQGEQIFAADYQLLPAGSFYRMIKDSNRLVADMVKSFSLSLLLVTLSILLLLRSPWLTLLSMIPNIIPILWTVGLMGYLKIDLSTGTAMIGAVVIGLAVDDTIHYLVHYRRVLNGSVQRAVTITTTRVGRALMITSMVLVFGFWVGCFGSFKPTIYFSLLVGGTLLGALICDLLVLPACLILGDASRKVRPA